MHIAIEQAKGRDKAGLWGPAARLLLGLSLLLGIAYPLAVTGVAQVLMPHAANGSLIVRDGKVLGSALIGQDFHKAGEFWGRPSATGGSAYNGAGSGGSNLGPSNPALRKVVAERIAVLKAAGPVPAGAIPQDLVTASGSGLDPHISLAAALYQLPRVAQQRKLSEAKLRALIDAHTEHGWFGDNARVNVLRLNMDLPR
ncbi:potassium-transporting ATPase subunit KdpC [Vogesella sp. GCM10023246]|uniref:Potassium-transporting ATPase KdpC subunit n=1 Tax=Vogesella oryzagri TaxID=3160864 RepID=A0ABV1MA45_9NEIS